MSKGYGIDIYGVDTYGYSQPIDYSVAPFTAEQLNYGEITLRWSTPNVTSWKLLQLVRSVYGYPNTPSDGQVLHEFTPGTMLRSYDDAGLVPGTIYYYTMFISVEAPTWSAATTYNINSQVLYNGLYWSSIQNGNTNNTPAAGSAFWTATDYVPVWYPAGYVASIAVVNSGYGTLIYDRAPQPYKTVTSGIFSNTVVDNEPLLHYISLFGFGLDILKTSYDSYLLLNNPDTISANYLDILGQQLGVQTNYLAAPQQRRQRVKNASVNYRMKGRAQGIHNLVAEIAGWDSDVTSGPNLYNSADASAFVHPTYDIWNENITYFPNQLVQYNGYNYKNLVESVGQAQAPTGTNSSNTWWSVQVQVLDTTTNLNPETNSYSIWSVFGQGTTTASSTGVLTGLPHPTDTTINNWNALNTVMTNNLGTGIYDVISNHLLYTPNWASGTNYVVNNYVLYTDGYYYRAVKPSGPGTPYGAVTPGTDQSYWQPFYYTTSDNPNLIRDGIPFTQLPQWNATTEYARGTLVQYKGITYLATVDNINQSPTGYYYSNHYWAFIVTSQNNAIVSSYWTRDSNNANPATIDAEVRFYDKNGILINNVSTSYTGYLLSLDPTQWVARFVTDYPDLQGTTEPSLINSYDAGGISGFAWTINPTTANLWSTSYGMAHVDQTLAGTTTYIFALLPVGQNSGGRFCVTFASDYIDTAHKTHGLVFAWVDANNFYYVTRQSLWHVSAGTETQLATWTRLSDGDRIVVDAATDIYVYKYARTGDGTITTLAHSVGTGPGLTGVSAYFTGLIQKYSASGAL